jgi:hypothetical protein
VGECSLERGEGERKGGKKGERERGKVYEPRCIPGIRNIIVAKIPNGTW